MAKITEDTTMAQLSIEKATLGISHITMMTDESGHGRVATVSHPGVGSRLGHGDTEAEAIENAFQRVRDAVAKSFK